MKKFVFTLFAVAALIACQSNNKQNQMTGEGEAVEIVGTDSTGLVDVFAYEGTVPTASGKKDSMDYLVIITQKIDSVNGVYQMTTTYITADGKSGKKPHEYRQKGLTYRLHLCYDVITSRRRAFFSCAFLAFWAVAFPARKSG